MAYEEEEDLQEGASASGDERQQREPSVVVGIGVCALSLSSLEQLFSDVDLALGASYLVAVRQQEGLDVATVLHVLKRQERLAVKVAEDGDRLTPSHVYIGGSNDMLTLQDGHVRVRSASEPIGHRGTIDTMLISLAEQAHERAIAVVLTGLGTDGAAGVAATKKFGGLSITEKPKKRKAWHRKAQVPQPSLIYICR